MLVVIPARNEQQTVAAIVAGVRAARLPVVVVDDASDDATAALARAAGARVLSLPTRLGAWGATQTGMRYALHNGYRAVATMDADGQHLARYLRVLAEPVATGASDVAIGAAPVRNSALRRFACDFFRLLTGLRLSDITSGFRVYNRRALTLLVGRQATLLDYQDVGVLLLLRGHGLRTVEVPVRMTPRGSGKSRVFGSWLLVARYMLQTTVLCLAAIGDGRHAR